MTSYVFPPAPQASVELAGRPERFPVRRIFCVGRNYAAHAREMGKDPDREPPFFFTKPADAVVDDGMTIPYPPQTRDLQYEGELVVAIGTGGRDIDTQNALKHVWGYACGNDLTRRDLQARAKEMGRPWDFSKGFDHSAAVGPIHQAVHVGHLSSGRIELDVNGVVRQQADLSDMIWSVSETIAIVSASIALQAGDLIMMGTPAGVGALEPGDACHVRIDGLSELTIRIGKPA